MKRCNHEGCVAEFHVHRGGIALKDGTAFCPDHLPDWVEDWRGKRGLARVDHDSVRLVGRCMNCKTDITRAVVPKELVSYVAPPWLHIASNEPDCPVQ